MKYIVSENAVIQHRFPVSKKRRIRKKWRKDKRNYKPCLGAIQVGDKYIIHPIAWQVIQEMERNAERSFFEEMNKPMRMFGSADYFH